MKVKVEYYVMTVFCQRKPASGHLMKKINMSSTADMMSMAMTILSC